MDYNLFEYFTYLYSTIKYYLFKQNEYNLPFNSDEIQTNNDFKDFKINNNMDKVIFALNNIPDIVQSILFNNHKNVADKYLCLTIKLNGNSIDEIYHNLQDINSYIDNHNIRYIYIRINLIHTKSKMNHVNCIIIDKLQKYIFLFEPKVLFTYDTKIIFELLGDIFDTSQYNKILPSDIGYTYYNRLQWYDTFCQTYILFIFWLIILNSDIEPENFLKLFTEVITHQNMGYLLFHIYSLLITNKIDICQQQNIWSYPTNNIKNLLNTVKLFLNSGDNKENQIDNIIIKEEDDMVIFETK